MVGYKRDPLSYVTSGTLIVQRVLNLESRHLVSRIYENYMNM